MNVVKKTVKIVAFALLAIIFVASLFVIILSAQQKKKGYPGAFGYTFEVVQTDSMSGTFEVGDIIVCKVIDADTVINEGDIVSFHTIVNGKQITKTHRVSKVWVEGSFGTVYETWGDNRVSCPTPDSGILTHEDIIGVYTEKKVDDVGNLLMKLETRTGYLVLAIPIGLYILYEIFALISIFMGNKKEQMLAETQDAKAAIIAEYLAAQQKAAAESAEKQAAPAPAPQEGDKKE